MDDGLVRLARPSGAFAMVALDQRESLRTMLAAHAHGELDHEAVSDFKVAATRILAPLASAVLLDVESGLAPVRDAGALPAGTGLIVAADRLTQRRGGPVEATELDDDVMADDAVAAVADAYKLLVIWREGTGDEARLRTVRSFVDACRRRGRPAVVEGIVRDGAGEPPPADRHAELVLAAAAELGAVGPDVYKAEVPTLGRSDDAAITAAAERLTAILDCPWVVLSNGTDLLRFGDAAVAAARGGASGFLAGRAIWLDALGASDVEAHLRTVAAPRLAGLAARIDTVARPWMEV
ncbi:MAG TPA: hypothetical protein VD763_13750 [Candidatus Saccharimonadales bacterium]|nr:hypothetical protein [Candidatus Saccharimonadales bacterium]